MAGPRDAPLIPTMPPDGTSQETIVLNDAGSWRLEQRTRTSKGGKVGVRYSLSIDAEPILTNLRGLDLGRGPAAAILELIRQQHRDIGEMAKPSTMARRRAAAKELAGGGSSRLARGEMTDSGDRVRRRYIAARTASDPPGTSVRVGSDSNTLYNGWFLRQNPAEGTWTVNVPANRLDPETFNGGVAALQAWVDRLVQLIPALTGKGILEDKAFIRAVGASKPVQVLVRGSGWTWSQVGQLARSVRGVAQAAGLI